MKKLVISLVLIAVLAVLFLAFTVTVDDLVDTVNENLERARFEGVTLT